MADSKTIKFDPATKNKVYDTVLPEWELNQDFAEMHLASLRDGDHLDAFGSEQETEVGGQYAKRKLWSIAIDHAQDLIGLRVDNIFRTLPKRNYDGSTYEAVIDAFLDDVDGGGTKMDAFMRKALMVYYVNGVDIVVDKSGSDIEPENQAQEDALGIKPVLHMFSPIERYDWAVDHADKYKWARYSLGTLPADDETTGEPGTSQYLTMTQTEWRLYTTATDGKGDTTVMVGTHGLDKAPIVSFYFKESGRADLPKVPLSLLTRISPIARYLLNLVSQIQLDIYRNIGFMVATGVEADKIPTEMTPMGCWALPEGATIEEVAGSVEHITEKRVLMGVLVETILRIGKLGGQSGELKARATSGVQVAVERTDLDNEMRMTAVQAEAVETEVVRMAVSRAVGKDISTEDLGYNVEYNKNYVLTGVSDIIANIKSLVETDVHVQVPEPLKALLRQLSDALVGEDEEARDRAFGEIDALVADEIISSKVKGANASDNAGGDADNLTL